MTEAEAAQRRICGINHAEYDPPDPGTRVGVALQTLGALPVHGLRIPPTPDTSGWYIWAGAYSPADDFYQPLCVEHVPDRWPAVVPFLALPPGWRFLTDDAGHVDVWFDAEMLKRYSG